MDFSQLEAFYQIAKLKNFHKAAEVLHISQPAISSRIKKLENELSVLLIKRDRKQVELTRYGKKLEPYVEKILGLSMEAVEEIKGIQNESQNRLEIGTTSRIGTYVLPNILKRFQLSFPNTEIVIRTDISKNILTYLTHDAIHIGLIHNPKVDHTFFKVPLLEDGILLVCSPNHPLSTDSRMYKRLSLKDISHYSIINFKRGTSYFEPLYQLLEEEIKIPMNTIIVDNLEAMKQMAKAGVGVAFLPQIAIQQELEEGSLLDIPFSQQEKVKKTTYLLYKKSPYMNNALQQFLQTIGQAK